MLKSILEKRIHEGRLSLRSTALEIGISHTTLNRVIAGDQYDLHTLMKIADWLNMKPQDILDFEKGLDAGPLLSLVPGLEEVLADAAAKIQSGELDLSALADITAYAKFRILESTNARARRKATDARIHGKN